jgi:uncharacterized protein YggE
MNIMPAISFSTTCRSVGALALVSLSACAPALAQGLPSPAPAVEEEKGTLQVTGQAEIQLPADQVTITLGVETESSSAREASALNASKMDAVIEALREAGGESQKIETFGYALSPEYRRPTQEDPSRQTISGYRARNSIRVTLSEVEMAGTLLDAGISAGANRVMSLQFSATNTREARLEALREAVRLAREEAQTIAEAMGVTLGSVLEVRGGASPGNPTVMYRSPRVMEMSSAPTPIEAGAQTVTANVTILYQILENAR